MDVAVIGAGASGARAARQLISTPGVRGVVVRDPDDAARRKVLESLGARADEDLRADGPISGVDVAVLALPAEAHGDLAARFVADGTSVVSVSDAIDDVEALLALDVAARERGVVVVPGAGFSPGFSCALVAHAVTGFDDVDEIHVAKVGTGGPACARQHHGALAGPAIDWRGQEWVRRSGGSGRQLSWFPDPIGARDCYRAALPDSLLLQRAFPGVDRITARVAANRRDRFTARLPMLIRPHPEGGPGGTRVEVWGRRSANRAVVVLGAMDWPGIAAGAVAAVTASWVGSGRVGREGVWCLSELEEQVPFLAELDHRGVRAAAYTGDP